MNDIELPFAFESQRFRRLRGDLIEAYKIITEKEKVKKRSSLSSATLVTTCKDTATSWPQNVPTSKSDVTFSANVWWALGIYY